jgi:hypothetical protein
MKLFAMTLSAVLFALGTTAQNTNQTNVSKTTTTTVKDSDGEKKVVRNSTVQEVQNVEFYNADSDALNKDVKASPVQVTATTEVILPDGTRRMVDVDRSAYYSLGGDRYQFYLDKTGYTIADPKGRKAGVIRPTSNNNYIYRTKDRTSFGYFDQTGNFVLETYDEKNDRVNVETFSRMP